MIRKILISMLFLTVSAASARANGWCFSLSASESISDFGPHGVGLDASLLAEVDPAIAFGLETGTAYMRDSPGSTFVMSWSPGATVGGYTDGITRNRGYYLGPAVRFGQSLYGIGSIGLYEMAGGDGRATDTRWGSSIGLGLSGKGRRESAAEFRVRFAPGRYSNATTYQFALGMHLR